MSGKELQGSPTFQSSKYLPTASEVGAGDSNDSPSRQGYQALSAPPSWTAQNADSGGTMPVIEQVQNERTRTREWKSVSSANHAARLAPRDSGYVSEELPIDVRSSQDNTPADGDGLSPLTTQTNESRVGVGSTMAAPASPNDVKESSEVVPGGVSGIHMHSDLARYSISTEGHSLHTRENTDPQSSDNSSNSRSTHEPIASPKPREALNSSSLYNYTFSQAGAVAPMSAQDHGGETSSTNSRMTPASENNLSLLSSFGDLLEPPLVQTRPLLYPPGFMQNSGIRSDIYTPFIPPTPTPSTPTPSTPATLFTPTTPFLPTTPLLPPPPSIYPYIPPLPSPDPPAPPSLARTRQVRYAPLVEERTMSPLPIDARPKSAYSTLVFGVHTWRQYTHPNGSLYWTCPEQRVISDKHPQFDTIASLPQFLQSRHDFSLWEVYLAGNSVHFIDHKSRSMSNNHQTLPEFQMEVQHGFSNIETKLKLEARYWMFVQSHPNHMNLPANAADEAEEALLWCYADRRLFESSTAPFEKDAAQEMLGILQHVSAISRPTLKVWFVAAIMRSVVQERSTAHYGTVNARNYRQLEKTDELPEFEILRSWWSIVIWNFLAWLAFGAPFGYLKRIINVDRSNGISTQRWGALLRNLCAEWADTNLLASYLAASVVLVSGTVAMLAVPGLNGVAQIAAFSSILCALSAVLAGTLLISNHRGRMESSGRAAFLYFDYAKRMTGSPHILAILLSLPLILTLWGMVWFVVSVASAAYNPGLPNIPHVFETVLRFTSISVVCVLVIVVAIVAWFFHTQRSSVPGVPATKRPILSPMPAPVPLTVLHSPDPPRPNFGPFATPINVETYRNPMTIHHPSYWPQPITQQTDWSQPPMPQHPINQAYSHPEADMSPPGWWQRLRDHRKRRYRKTQGLSMPVASQGRENYRPPFTGNLSSWGNTAEHVGMGPPGQFVPYFPPTTDPSIVQLLRENQTAQLAVTEQLRELMRHMTGLNQWLERDVQGRQAELRSVSARVDNLRDNLHHTQM